MQWLELCIQTCSAGIELVGERLTVLGYDSFIVDDQAEFETFLEQNKQYWDYVDQGLQEKMEGLSQIRLYLEDNAQAMETVRHLQEELQLLRRQNPGKELGTLEIRISNLQDEDWENNWKQYYQPIRIGRRLLVVPEWLQEDPGVQAELQAGRVPLVLDPGLTFGTGNHATTQLCLTALERSIHGGERVLDLGCGSGILSIAALKLGAGTALAVDIDDKCQDVAYENAARNQIGRDRYTVRIGDVVRDEDLQAAIGGGYQVVLANIVADVIIGLAPMVRSLLAEDGRFLCSGIIDSRAEEVAEQLKQNGLEILETHSADGWYAYLCR